MAEQLDQGVVNLAKAIRYYESGDNFDARGASGEHGAYQYMPATWQSWAGKYLNDPNAELSKENQNKVAYSRIKEWKDQGYNPAQIASMWNSGQPEWEGKVGVNSAGVKYDVPAYVRNVGDVYKKIKAGQQPGAVTGGPSRAVGVGAAPEEKKSLGIADPEMGMKVAGGIATGIGKAYDWFSQLPGIKQASQAVGKAVQTGGEVIGEGVGALGETGIQAVKAVQGKGFDANRILQTAEETAKTTGEFGKQIGEEGLPAAVLGEFGGFIPNAAMAYSQGYLGTQDIYKGLKEGDTAKAVSGALRAGSGVAGLKGMAAEAKGGMLMSPNVEAAKQTVIGEAKKFGPGAEMTAKVALKPYETYKEVTAPKRFAKAEVKLTNQYRDIIRMSPTQEAYEANWDKDTPAFLAKEGGVTLRAEGNKLDTLSKAVPELQAKYKVENVAFKKLLQDSGAYINIDQTVADTIKSLDRLKSQGIEYDRAVKYVQEQAEAWKKNYAADVVMDDQGQALLPAAISNDIKSGSWSKAFGQSMLTKDKVIADVDFQLGKSFQKAVEDAIPDANVKAMNKRLGDFASAIRMLTKRHGLVLKGGMLGKWFAREIGAMAGSHFGPLGSVAGALSADFVIKKLSDPEFSTGAARKLVNELSKDKDGRTILEQVDQILSQRQATRATRKLLPPPTAIPLGPGADTSRLYSQEEAKALLTKQGYLGQATNNVKMDQVSKIIKEAIKKPKKKS